MKKKCSSHFSIAYRPPFVFSRAFPLDRILGFRAFRARPPQRSNVKARFHAPRARSLRLIKGGYGDFQTITTCSRRPYHVIILRCVPLWATQSTKDHFRAPRWTARDARYGRCVTHRLNRYARSGCRSAEPHRTCVGLLMASGLVGFEHWPPRGSVPSWLPGVSGRPSCVYR